MIKKRRRTDAEPKKVHDCVVIALRRRPTITLPLALPLSPTPRKFFPYEMGQPFKSQLRH